MSAYHESIPQPYRIQKRLALNQCFKAVFAETGDLNSLVYVTLGGEDLYDVMDLVAVFDIRRTKIWIFSYEHKRESACRALDSAVYQTISKVNNIRIKVLPDQFPSKLDQLERHRPGRPFIYFLDYTGTFRAGEMNTVVELLQKRLVKDGDYLLITSCLSPRIVNQSKFMASDTSSFQLLFGTSMVDGEFRARNHVDLLVALAFARYERLSEASGPRHRLRANLLRKFKYADSKSPMGLWLYNVQVSRDTSYRLPDLQFDTFPYAFSTVRDAPPSIPNIFE